MAETVQQVKLADVRIDGQTQTRVAISEETVADYAELYRAGADLPPVAAMFDGVAYWLVDGFHRFYAARKAGLGALPVSVTTGTCSEARWAACAANQAHGLRRTNADKRRAVTLALELHPEMSDGAIASHVGVHRELVLTIRRETFQAVGNRQPGEPPQPQTRTGTDGKRYPVPPARPPPARQPPMPPPPARSGPPVATPAERFGSSPVARTAPPPPPPAPETEPPSAEAVVPPPAAPATEVVRDAVGRRIPTRCLPVWQRLEDARELTKAIRHVTLALMNAQDNRDPLFAEVNLNAALAHANNLYATVKPVEPYAVCPYCQGDNPADCQACCGRGMVSKYRWDNVCARELKEAAVADAAAG